MFETWKLSDQILLSTQYDFSDFCEKPPKAWKEKKVTIRKNHFDDLRIISLMPESDFFQNLIMA
jgi:hypothetical protein